MKIWAHTMVKNEGRFLWYAVKSVINYIDNVLLWDTGSSDETAGVIGELKREYSDKIQDKFVGEVTTRQFAKVRQDMLDATRADFVLMLDGDEIWWKDSIKEVISKIKSEGKRLESIVVPTVNLVGDIYHYQEEKAGNYRLAGRVGHLNLRAFSTTIPGLSSQKPHGQWGWTDGRGQMIQDRAERGIKFIDAPYLHASFLRRSSEDSGDLKVPKRKSKRRYELGISFPRDYYYPEAFFERRPKFIPSPWESMGTSFLARAVLETPLRKIKRRLLPESVGY